MLTTLLGAIQLATSLLPTVVSLITEARAAFESNDQAALDAVHARAQAAADALKPAGA